MARRQARRSRFRFDTEPDLADRVRSYLIKGYSPYAVAYLLGDVCTETIYQGIYSGRRRHPRQPTSGGNYLGDFTPKRSRPLEITRRQRFDHWEGDLITGTSNKSAILTLTERVTRF